MSTQTATKAELKQELANHQERAKRFSNKLPTNELADLGKAVAEAMKAIKDGDYDNAQDALKDLGGIIDGHEETVSRNANVVPLRPGEPEHDTELDPDTAPLGAFSYEQWPDDDEELDTPPDAILETDGGHCVFAHKIFTILCAKRGRGKTWIALLVALSVALAGGRVVYFYYDRGTKDGLKKLGRRLRALGADDTVFDRIIPIATRKPKPDDLVKRVPRVIEWLKEVEDGKHSLVIIDSFSKAGGAPNDLTEFNEWEEWLINPCLDTGLGVLGIAHESKSPEAKGPVGTFLSEADCDLLLRVVRVEDQKVWTRQFSGEVTLVQLKDRDGVTGVAEDDPVAVVHGEPVGSGLLELTLKDPPGSKFNDAQRAQAGTPKPSNTERGDDLKLLKVIGDTPYKMWDMGRAKLLDASPFGGVPTLLESLKRLKARGEIDIDPNPGKATRYRLTQVGINTLTRHGLSP